MPLFQMPPSDVDLADPSEVAKLIERVFSTPLELKRTSMKIKAKNPMAMNLFQLGDFTLSSGRRSSWKIECDALTAEDWRTLAAMGVEMLDKAGISFHCALGVPTGGAKLAEALQAHLKPPTQRSCVLVVDDVLTSGGSILRVREHVEGANCWGLVAFARGKCPPWVLPIFQLSHELAEGKP